MANCMKFIIRFLTVILLASIMTSLPFGFAQSKTGAPVYVGSEACKKCHENEYKNFITYAKKCTSFTSIERVRKSLTEEELKGCFSCHTTGYGKPGGFISLEKTPHLKNAGCEVCHGPGEFHIKSTGSKDIKRHLTIKDCEGCHISERVKTFRYKPLIHGGAH